MIPEIHSIYEDYTELEHRQLQAEYREAGRQTLLDGRLQRPTFAVTASGVLFPQH